jgi:2-dehydropantoate 2-reductase
MRLLVAGAGAVGGFLAARFLDGGHDVTVLARPRRAAQLRNDGLKITGASGQRVLWPGVITAGKVTAPYETVMVAVKADALTGVMNDIRPAVGPATVVVPFLNGMGHVAQLGQHFGPAVIGGVLRIVTQLADTGAVQVLAPTFEVEIGEFDAAPSRRVETLAAAFRDAGADVTLSSDITAAMWAKWVFIASIGAITSLMRAPVGDIVSVPGGMQFARSVVAEAAGVAAAAGHPVSADQLRGIDGVVTAPGSTVTSSLSRDLMAGRPAEVDAVIGDLAVRGQALGVATPGLSLTELALRVHNRRLDATNGP